ncbi:MAG: hypothetical protein FWF15_08895 [Oscillospiraceae bacterium]|nr:hypothetical protein [Oscillospiraceae bacterium]
MDKKLIEITGAGHGFEECPLLAPFGFKGGSSSFLWNTMALLKSGDLYGCGLGTEGILWSDEKVFFTSSNLSGSAMMFLMTSYALKRAIGVKFREPPELLDILLPDVYEYGRKVTGVDELRKTFALNSLVAVDNAAWQLYFRANGLKDFEDIIPDYAAPMLQCRHEKLACVSLVTYNVTEDYIKQIALEQAPLMKIKIGKDPEWDIERLKQIHSLIGGMETPYTESGHILYYLDANGRYENLDSVMRLIDVADKIGAFDRIVLFEEPFSEGSGIDVSTVPVCVAADESAHSDEDVENLAQLGYKAVALKPIAKTLSMTFRMLAAARKYNLDVFCADLTVNPIMVDWNKNVNARLKPLHGMKIGAMESNGAQNYTNWAEMEQRHPCYGADWIAPKDAIYTIDDDFYARSGGIFEDSKFYLDRAMGNAIN